MTSKGLLAWADVLGRGLQKVWIVILSIPCLGSVDLLNTGSWSGYSAFHISRRLFRGMQMAYTKTEALRLQFVTRSSSIDSVPDHRR